MSAISFPEYAREITRLLDTLVTTSQAKLTSLQVDQRSMLRGLVSGALVFEDDSELHFREFVDLTQTRPVSMYAYHYQEADKTLIFRYDNAAHRRRPIQEEHKHTPENVIPAPAPSFAQVIDETLSHLSQRSRSRGRHDG